MKRKVDELIDSVRELWSSFDEHPFVKGIADGTLDKDKFKYYQIQDYLYLIDYARVFALGAVKASDSETMRLCASYVKQILDGEMDIHKGYMQRLGISIEEAEQTKAALDNLSYTSYMLRVAYDGGAAEVMAAILSCAVSYEFIGRHMVEQNSKCVEHEFYGEWIKGYASPEYAKANRALEELTERLIADCSESHFAKLKEIFINCSLYEGAFWDMSWEMR